MKRLAAAIGSDEYIEEVLSGLVFNRAEAKDFVKAWAEDVPEFKERLDNMSEAEIDEAIDEWADRFYDEVYEWAEEQLLKGYSEGDIEDTIANKETRIMYEVFNVK